MKKEELNTLKLFYEAGVKVLDEITPDDFTFSRLNYFDKQLNRPRKCVVGWLDYKNYPLGPINLIQREHLSVLKLHNYLTLGMLLRYVKNTTPKTIAGNTPYLNPYSSLEDVKTGWKFVAKNYEKMLKAL